MSKFEVVFTVNSHDTDKNGNLYPSTALRYLHEAANLQLDSTHPTMDELRYGQKKAFILSRASMTLSRPLHKNERVLASTWAGGGKAATFYRCGELIADGEVVGKLVSLWALVDLDTRKLCRVRDTELGVDTLEEYPLDIPAHVRFPEGLVFEEVGKRRVYNSDIDLNGHMNNTNYPDLSKGAGYGRGGRAFCPHCRSGVCIYAWRVFGMGRDAHSKVAYVKFKLYLS